MCIGRPALRNSAVASANLTPAVRGFLQGFHKQTSFHILRSLLSLALPSALHRPIWDSIILERRRESRNEFRAVPCGPRYVTVAKRRPVPWWPSWGSAWWYLSTVLCWLKWTTLAVILAYQQCSVKRFCVCFLSPFHHEAYCRFATGSDTVWWRHCAVSAVSCWDGLYPRSNVKCFNGSVLCLLRHSHAVLMAFFTRN
jgi:hypothetical protein